jgi:hydroxymethylbilane synthase
MRIGTRGSALALAQADSVARLLGEPTEIIKITTAGDRGAEQLDKSRWVSALEQALLEDRIDIAVHSAKDVPTEPVAGLELIAVPARADPRDAICGAAGLRDLAPGARIGTSSLRRAAQIRAARDDIEVVDLSGNVDTRLRKLAEGQVDAILLAFAGLQRLAREAEAGAVLDDLVPAAGQGALAVQARPGRLDAEALARLTDEPSMACVAAERELVHALGATCNTPVGAHAERIAGGNLRLTGWVGLPDGSAWLRDQVHAPALKVGTLCAERMLAGGAASLLEEAMAADGAQRESAR